MLRRPKFLMLASELSSRGKRKTRTRTLRAEKASRQKAENPFRGVESGLMRWGKHSMLAF